MVYSEPIPSDQPPLGGLDATRVAIRRDATIEYTRVSTPQPVDEFDLDVRLGAVGGSARPGADVTIGGAPPTMCATCPDDTCEPTCRDNTCPAINTCRTCQTCHNTCNTCQGPNFTCETCLVGTCGPTCQNTCFPTCRDTCETCQTQCGTCPDDTCATCARTCATCMQRTCWEC